jgi:hypothetical protein
MEQIIYHFSFPVRLIRSIQIRRILVEFYSMSVVAIPGFPVLLFILHAVHFSQPSLLNEQTHDTMFQNFLQL